MCIGWTNKRLDNVKMQGPIVEIMGRYLKLSQRRCYTMLIGKYLQTFQSIMVPSQHSAVHKECAGHQQWKCFSPLKCQWTFTTPPSPPKWLYKYSSFWRIEWVGELSNICQLDITELSGVSYCTFLLLKHTSRVSISVWDADQMCTIFCLLMLK